jgi:hypothetical protein
LALNPAVSVSQVSQAHATMLAWSCSFCDDAENDNDYNDDDS